VLFSYVALYTPEKYHIININIKYKMMYNYNGTYDKLIYIYIIFTRCINYDAIDIFASKKVKTKNTPESI